MGVWEVLEIEPTEDIPSIKKAYSQKLKVHHPEDDPEGYQRLREAYDYAMKVAKKGAIKETGPSFSDESNIHIWPNPPNTVELTVETIDRPEEIDPVDEFMEQVEEVYSDFSSRISHEQWSKLLNNDIVWNVRLNEIVEVTLLDFLHEHRFLPKRVWESIEYCFRWRELATEDPDDRMEHFTEEFYHFYCRQLDEPALRYTFIQHAADLDYDVFLNKRETAYQALKENNLELAGQSLDEAYAMYSDDPDLLRLQGEYFLRMGEKESALAVMEHGIRIYPDDIDWYLIRSRIWYETHQFVEAKDECLYVLSRMPANMGALRLLGKCFIQLGELEKAEENYLKILESFPNDIDAITSLAHIRSEMVERAKRRTFFTRRSVIKRLYKKLGKPNFFGSVKLFWMQMPKAGVVFILSFILFLHVLLSNPFINDSGLTPISYLKNRIHPVELSSTEVLNQLDYSDIAQIKLPSVHFLGITEYHLKAQTGAISTRYNSSYSKQRNWARSILPTAWFYVAKLDNSSIVLLVSDANQAVQIQKSNFIDSPGTIVKMPQELPEYVWEVLQITDFGSKYKDSKFVVDKLIVVHNVTNEVPVKAVIYSVLLLVLYALLLRLIVRTYKTVRF
ncbi:J domain-containing protein [Brevibacillus sp. HB1.3]|uniref:J domain-containing protein n=1 Tax=Brevibacillus sp. HB1.3 TaxID=2738842 RepID=UPI001C12EF94|nr:J domain-containing protein [Brevibacillus sp. HB1.3]